MNIQQFKPTSVPNDNTDTQQRTIEEGEEGEEEEEEKERHIVQTQIGKSDNLLLEYDDVPNYETSHRQLKSDNKLDYESLPDIANNFGDILDAVVEKYCLNTTGLTERKKLHIVSEKIRHPNYDTEIFNPFRKSNHYLKPKSTINSNNMKYDYRRETSSSGSAIDSGKNTAKHALDYRKTYLFLYNVVMFVMFLMVFMILVIKVISGTIDDDTVRGSATIIKLLTYTQLLESIHPMLGLVPGGPMMPLLQVIGRILVNLFLEEPTIRINSAPYSHYLFIVWSCIEIFRYSFYALRVFNVDVFPLTWCRYTLFMPLYPMGGFCESQVILSTINYYGKTRAYSVGLPNWANISFDLPIFLKFYIIVLLGPSIAYLMRYMWFQRCKQLKKDKMD